MSGEWHVVNKGQKKREQKEKKEVEALYASIPGFTPLSGGPIALPPVSTKEHAILAPKEAKKSSVFKDYIDDKISEEKQRQAKEKAKKQQQQQQKQSQTKKEKQDKAKTETSSSGARLTSEGVEELLSELKEKYTKSEDAQLKGLAEEFEGSSLGQDKPILFALPLRPNTSDEVLHKLFANQESRQMVIDFIDKISFEAVARFVAFLIEQISDHNGRSKVKGQTSGNGLRTLLLLIGRSNHSTALYQNQGIWIRDFEDENGFIDSNVTTLFLYFFAQFWHFDIATALELWYERLLPLINPTLSPSILAILQPILDNSVSRKEELANLDGKITTPGLITVTKLRHDNVDFKKDLGAENFHKLKNLSVLQTRPHEHFKEVLLEAFNANERYVFDILGILTEILVYDVQAFSVWSRNYPTVEGNSQISTIPQSNNLIYFLNLHWEHIAQRVRILQLDSLMKKFKEVNRRLIAKDSKTKVPRNQIIAIDDNINLLGKKIRGAGSGMMALLLFVILIFVVTLSILLYVSYNNWDQLKEEFGALLKTWTK